MLPDSLLLVEDSPLIAMDVEETLLEIGVGSIEVASTVAQALTLIADRRFDAAILDITLESETSLPIAERLLGLGVPFAFATGHGAQFELGPQFAEVPILRKPYGREELLDVLASEAPL